MQEPDFKKIAAQLRNPSGEEGLETARRMEDNNAVMIRTCIDQLPLHEGDQVLEIGPGGGGHLPYLFTKNDSIRYTGADISETMVQQAAGANKEAVAAGKAVFQLVEAIEGVVVLPFEAAAFDVIFTVNTLYFWDDAPAQAAELYRVLKPGGRLALCFSTEAFMKTLPFTRYDFRLYHADEAKCLIEDAGFTISDISERTEMVMSFEGKPLEREFVVLRANR